MAFEYLDLENKLYIPTQTLITQFQNELMSLYVVICQSLIDVHNTVALLGKEWYDNPIDTSSQWFELSVAYGSELYARVVNDLMPKAEVEYEEILLAVNDLGNKTSESIDYVIENPEQVTAETIEIMTASLIEAGNISTELVAELQSKHMELLNFY